MPTDLRETISSLSPGALTLFKRQLQGLPEKDRQLAYTRLQGIPELVDLLGRPPQEDIIGKLPVPQQEQPKLGQIMGSKDIPLWQKGLAGFAAPFQFIHERAIEPLIALGTAPFTPTTAKTAGLSGMERHLAEYRGWQEPEFTMPWGGKFRPTKGVLEFLPWLAIPGIGAVGAKGGMMAGRGIAGALGRMGTAGKVAGTALEYTPWGVAEKVAGKAFGVAGKAAGKVTKPLFQQIKSIVPEESIIDSLMARAVPSETLLNEAYKPTAIRTFAQWAKDKPIVGQVIKALGGESIFVKAESDLPMDILRRATVNRARLLNYSQNLEGALLPRLRQLGNAKQVLGIGDDGLLSTVVSAEGKSRYLIDVLENPSAYKFTNPIAEQYVKEFTEIRKVLREMLENEGLKQSKKVHRIVEGIITEDGRIVKSKFGSDPTLSRVYETMEEAVQAHLGKGQKILYGLNPNDTMAYEINRTINRIARKRFTDVTKKLGRTPKQIYAEVYPEQASKLINLYARKDALKSAQTILQRMLSYKVRAVPGATLAKLRRELNEYAPELAQNIETVFSMKKPNVEKIMRDMAREVNANMKIKPIELNLAVKTIRAINVTWRGKKVITLSDIDDAVRSLNVDKELEEKLIVNAYTEAYKANKAGITNFIKANRDAMTSAIDDTKNTIRPLSKERSKFLQGYAGRERLPHKAGEVAERPFNVMPEFRNMFFPDEITTYLEKTYFDEGTKWLRTMGSVSAISRNLTAVLDDSAPFIQGLFVFGRSPVQWAKATIKQFEFFIKPENFNKYMVKPEIQFLHAEMLKAGSTIQRFELVEAMPQLEKLAGRIPIIGQSAQRAFQATYGRAEAAFTGFGQVARDNMWKALRKPGMAEGQLQELARTLDLMTGNLSTAALGIPRTQRDIEQAWVFFSPRFTRASLAFIGDAFRGGLAGAEARKSIAGLMVAGSAMYLGVCKVTGQEPNFDPTSGRFMTVKVGDDYVGVGGMLYSLARLSGNLATVEDPADLLKLDRFDNPFIKFMYGKAAPLTGMVTGLIEQQDYMGRPFESVADWGRFLAEKVVPFSVAPLLEEEIPGAASFGAQFAGLRTFPESLWGKRTELRDQYAVEKYSRKFGELTKLEQKRIDKSSEIQRISKRMEEEGRETPENLTWARWNREGESIEDMFRDEIEKSSAEFRATGNGIAFRDRVDTAKAVRREMYARRSQSPDYEMIQEYLNQPKSPEKMAAMNPLDIAREEYYKVMFDPSTMYDQYGRYNHELAKLKENQFTQVYGQAALDYVEAYEGAKWEGTPELRLLQEARQVLEPYWQIEDQIWAMYPAGLKELSDQIKIMENTNPEQARLTLKRYPMILRARELIAKYRKQMREMNPAIQQAYRLHYA